MVSGNICLAKRGSCTFVDKARICEQAGAAGAIIIGELIMATWDNLLDQ